MTATGASASSEARSHISINDSLIGEPDSRTSRISADTACWRWRRSSSVSNRRSSFSALLRSVLSRTIDENPRRVPSRALSGEIDTETSTSRPSRRRHRVSSASRYLLSEAAPRRSSRIGDA